MPEHLTVTVNGAETAVPQGTTVAVAIMLAGQVCRTSASGEPRRPLCGMGICYECRAAIDGVSHCRSCQIVCSQGMGIRTDE